MTDANGLSDLQYLGKHRVHVLINEMLVDMLRDRPDDPLSYIQSWSSHRLPPRTVPRKFSVLVLEDSSMMSLSEGLMNRQSSVNFQRRTSRADRPPERVSYPPPLPRSQSQPQALSGRRVSVPEEPEQIKVLPPSASCSDSGSAEKGFLSGSVNCSGALNSWCSQSEIPAEVPSDAISVDGSSVDPDQTMDWRPSPESLAATYESPQGKYLTLDRISRGHYGTVYRGVCLQTNLEVAIKKVAIDGHWVVNEFNNLQYCASPHVVECYGCFYDRDDDMLWFVMECLEHTLETLIPKTFGEYPSEEDTSGVIKQCLVALQEIHAKNRVHLDVKPANLLYRDLSEIKIGDLGTMGILGDPCIQLGDFVFMAPEVAYSQGLFTDRSDIWGIGALTLTLIDGAPPLCREEPNMLMYIHHETCMVPSLLEPHKWSKDLNDFIRSCFTKNTQYRPSAAELLQHPWISRQQRSDLAEVT
jgi:hypothetical protein